MSSIKSYRPTSSSAPVSRRSQAPPAAKPLKADTSSEKMGAAVSKSLGDLNPTHCTYQSPRGIVPKQLLAQISQVKIKQEAVVLALANIGRHGEDPGLTQEEKTKLLESFLAARDGYDVARRNLIRGRLPDSTTVGTPPQQVNSDRLDPRQATALWRFLFLFQSPEALGVRGWITSTTSIAHPQLLLALSDAITSPHSSIDPSGACNIDHLGSVFRGVICDTSAHLGRPLHAAEINEILTTTIMTDIWFKGRTPAELDSARMAPMVTSVTQSPIGETGKDFQNHLRQVAKQAVREGKPCSSQVLSVFDGWIDKDFVPMTLSQVNHAGVDAGLDPAYLTELREVWEATIIGPGVWEIANGFLRGTLMHGLQSFDQINDVVQDAGALSGSLIPQKVYLCALSHHICEFVIEGLAIGQAAPDFVKMEEAGQLPKGTSPLLKTLYKQAMILAMRWRPSLDQAISQNSGLSDENRTQFRDDGGALRAAISKLPLEAQRQLYFDDYMQFTHDGIGKWLKIYDTPESTTNGQLLNQLYTKGAQRYLEVAYARDLGIPGSEPGKIFLEMTLETAGRFGIHFDVQTRTFREARPGEEEHQVLAAAISSNAELRSAAGESRVSNPSKLVEWFRQQAKSPSLLKSLAQPLSLHHSL